MPDAATIRAAELAHEAACRELDAWQREQLAGSPSKARRKEIAAEWQAAIGRINAAYREAVGR